MLLSIIAVVIFAVWAYIFFVREWMVAQWPEKFSWWHLLEDKLWENSRTLLAARVYWVGGILIFIHDALAQSGMVDWTPLIGEIAKLFPDPYRPLVVAAWPVATGVLFEALRWMTTQSVMANKMEKSTLDAQKTGG